jgi:hypothetical protein
VPGDGLDDSSLKRTQNVPTTLEDTELSGLPEESLILFVGIPIRQAPYQKPFANDDTVSENPGRDPLALETSLMIA